MIGQRLGHYEITGSLGKGGMGEVWRARDTKLGREVAIKTLPTALAGDADRLARFEREAKLLATLNHAHIASVYGLDEYQGTRFLAMELIEGQSLEERLKEGPLPVEEALRLALQIAQALEAAHEKGVVHRDLKPANVMVTRDVVKVLDFGLAKAFSGRPEEASPAHSPALSLAMTQQGIILGTAAYMSPEQASGQGTDQRADVWSFGVVLYEMLTGMPLFSGESVPHVLADVLRSDPDWKRLPKNLHPRVNLVLERCLVKKPRNRYHSIADVRIDLEQLLADPRGVEWRDETHQASAPRPFVTRLASGAGLLIVGALIASLIAWTLWPAPGAPPVRRYSEIIERIDEGYAMISSDGSLIGYTAGDPPGIRVRNLGEFDARVVDAGDSTSYPPCFSPAGDWFAFTSGSNSSSLQKAPVAGGRSLPLAEGLALAQSCYWGEDSYIYFQSGSGIGRVHSDGGDVEYVSQAKAGDLVHGVPRLLPGGRELLYSVVRSLNPAVSYPVIVDLETRQETIVAGVEGLAVFARSSPNPDLGHLIFGQNDSVFAAPFDVRQRRIGAPILIAEGLITLSGFSVPTVSDTGTLLYLTGETLGGIGPRLGIFNRDGAWTTLLEPERIYGHVALAPAGEPRAALGLVAEDSSTISIWLYEFDGGRMSPLTADAAYNVSPVFTPDGEQVLYAASQSPDGPEWSIRSIPADRSGPAVTVATSRAALFPQSLSPDGGMVAGIRDDGTTTDIFILPLAAALDGTPATEQDLIFPLASSANEQHASFSPDGRWIAYTSDESGRDEVYVLPVAGPGGPKIVSREGGWQPRWHPAGNEILFLAPGGTVMLAVDVDGSGAEFRVGTPYALFDLLPTDFSSSTSSLFSVMADGRMVMLQREVSTVGAARLNIVENWFGELLERAPLSGLPP